MTIIIFVVVFALSLLLNFALAMAALKAAPEPVTPVTSLTDDRSSKLISVTPKKVGDTFTLKNQDGKELSATLVSYLPVAESTNKSIRPAVGKHYAAVQLSITNTGTAPLNENAETSSILLDSTNQFYTVDFTTVANCAPFAPGALTNLAPGQTAVGCLTFQVPNGATASTFKFTPSSGYAAFFGLWDL